MTLPRFHVSDFAGLLAAVVLVFFLHGAAAGKEKTEYTNPIMAGFYPDPSICRVGTDYYLVNSTFAYFPGITVHASKDLVHWKLLGYVLDDPEVFNLDSAGVSRGIFAPAIRYDRGVFYVTCTLVDKGGNFVATAKNPAGPWSKPAWLPEINGIDPSLFFDDNGKSYIVYNSVAPDDKPLYSGHRTIRIREFDAEKLTVVGEERILINGGTNIAEKPAWIEGPHIFKKDGSYYLICAEGGTEDNHSEVVFKSGTIDGPYLPHKNNPILTQRDLDPRRSHPITCTGHADFVETPKGNWYAVFLGCRPYPPFGELYYNTGRETFLAPVKWHNGWPTIISKNREVKYRYPSPLPVSAEEADIPHSGNLEYSDNFSSSSLNPNWEFLRTPHERWYNLKATSGFLSIRVRPETCAGKLNPSFIGFRQSNATCEASTALDFSPKGQNEKAGLLIFQNETHFYYLCKSREGNNTVVQLYKSLDDACASGNMQLLSSTKLDSTDVSKELSLRIEAHQCTYSFSFAPTSGKWITMKDSIDATYLSTRTAGGFVGCMYAMYATSLGEPSENVARFDWFKYKGQDEVYTK